MVSVLVRATNRQIIVSVLERAKEWTNNGISSRKSNVIDK